MNDECCIKRHNLTECAIAISRRKVYHVTGVNTHVLYTSNHVLAKKIFYLDSQNYETFLTQVASLYVDMN